MWRRSDATTGGPMVRLGTKWPSITSTCSRSASAATAYRRPRPGPRSRPTGSTGRSRATAISRPPHPQQVHAVGAGGVGKRLAGAPGPDRRPGRSRTSPASAAADGCRSSSGRRRTSRPQSVHSARRRPPWRTVTDGRAEYPALQRGQFGDVPPSGDPPPGVRPPAQHAEPGTGRVDQHPVGHSLARRGGWPPSTTTRDIAGTDANCISGKPAGRRRLYVNRHNHAAGAQSRWLPPGAAHRSTTRSLQRAAADASPATHCDAGFCT